MKEGPFLNSETDFPSGCSQLVHLKSQRIINDVSSGPVCAPTSQKEALASNSGGFTLTRGHVHPQPSLLVKREFGLSFPGPVSPTSGRQTTSLYSGSFSPKAGNKQSSLPSSSPMSPTSGKKESVHVPFSTPPHTTKQAILPRTGWIDEQKVASPKAESNTKAADDFIPEDQDGGLIGFPRGQPDVPWTQANIQQDSALEETKFSPPLADGVSLDYSNMHGEENEFRPDGSSIDADMDEESPSHREVNFIQPESFVGSHLSDSDHKEYDDHNIGDRAADNMLPVVVSPKKIISNERLKIILRLVLDLLVFQPLKCSTGRNQPNVPYYDFVGNGGTVLWTRDLLESRKMLLLLQH